MPLEKKDAFSPLVLQLANCGHLWMMILIQKWDDFLGPKNVFPKIPHFAPELEEAKTQNFGGVLFWQLAGGVGRESRGGFPSGLTVMVSPCKSLLNLYQDHGWRWSEIFLWIDRNQAKCPEVVCFVCFLLELTSFFC